MSHTEQGGEDDKDILIRDNIIIRGSSEYESDVDVQRKAFERHDLGK